ncbi:hypothetical protein BaRGS_00012929 [Batillaria attramentaria]|uniref:Uncharacterized protein n=1 Tax=Batillaria attramentaria TaxID=370345 RepID=A0ABD0L9Y0_9CAEN
MATVYRCNGRSASEMTRDSTCASFPTVGPSFSPGHEISVAWQGAEDEGGRPSQGDRDDDRSQTRASLNYMTTECRTTDYPNQTTSPELMPEPTTACANARFTDHLP